MRKNSISWWQKHCEEKHPKEQPVTSPATSRGRGEDPTVQCRRADTSSFKDEPGPRGQKGGRVGKGKDLQNTRAPGWKTVEVESWLLLERSRSSLLMMELGLQRNASDRIGRNFILQQDTNNPERNEELHQRGKVKGSKLNKVHSSVWAPEEKRLLRSAQQHVYYLNLL